MRGINLSPLSISKEVVEFVKTTLACFRSSTRSVTSRLRDIIVNWSVARVGDGSTEVVVVGSGSWISVASSLNMAVGILIIT